MKIKDMLMVIYNRKGIEKNFLCSFEHFIKNYAADYCDSYFQMAEVAASIQETKKKDSSFFEMYPASNKTFYVRYCSSLDELRLFIAGKLNDGMTNVFEEDFCDEESLDVLSRLGISTDRSMAVAKWPHYEKLESDLRQGEVYHNFNGSDYRLVERYSDRNMLFMDVDSSQFMVGIGVDQFVRYPQGEDRYSSNADYTFLSIHEKRGWAGMNEAGVLPFYRGIIVHDCWGSYWKYENVVHSICCAHLLRELNGVEENHPEQTWATQFKELLLSMKKAKETAMASGKASISSNQLEMFDKQYDEIIKTAYAENPLPETAEKKRGRKKKSKVLNLIGRLDKYKASVCLFIKNFCVPFDFFDIFMII